MMEGSVIFVNDHLKLLREIMQLAVDDPKAFEKLALRMFGDQATEFLIIDQESQDFIKGLLAENDN